MNQRFEDYIKDYFLSLSELSQYANEKGIIDRYYSTAKGDYKKFLDKCNSLELTKFGIRHYRAKKEMFASAQMFIEAKRTKEVGCIIGHFFLCYYSLFHAMQSLLFLNHHLDDEKVLNLTHSEVKKYFEDFYCKGNKSIIPKEILDLFTILKEYRELYSYTMPFNNPPNVMVQFEKLEYYITLCYQLLNLNSFIVYKIRYGISYNYDTDAKKYFEKCCFKIDPVTNNLIQDDADKNFWHEVMTSGIDLSPYSIQMDHDMDEYGGYDEDELDELGFRECDTIKMSAFRFIYNAIL